MVNLNVFGVKELYISYLVGASWIDISRNPQYMLPASAVVCQGARVAMLQTPSPVINASRRQLRYVMQGWTSWRGPMITCGESTVVN
jgi:hypothetical protein